MANLVEEIITPGTAAKVIDLIRPFKEFEWQFYAYIPFGKEGEEEVMDLLKAYLSKRTGTAAEDIFYVGLNLRGPFRPDDGSPGYRESLEYHFVDESKNGQQIFERDISYACAYHISDKHAKPADLIKISKPYEDGLQDKFRLIVTHISRYPDRAYIAEVEASVIKLFKENRIIN